MQEKINDDSISGERKVIDLGEKSERVKERTIKEKLKALIYGLEYKISKKQKVDEKEHFITAEIDKNNQSDLNKTYNNLETKIEQLEKGKFYQGTFRGIKNNDILGEVVVFSRELGNGNIYYYLPIKNISLDTEFILVDN